jgi:hydroxyacylglutathione hydrolase
MALVTVFTFNPFEENTIVLSSPSGECIIFDPGCYFSKEETELKTFISESNLKPIRLINTHAHLDHIYGNDFIHRQYGLLPEMHIGELPVLKAAEQIAQMYGVPMSAPSPLPEKYIEDGDIISFGNITLEAIFTPGHSPASLSFYCKEEKFLIAGDVLFRESIGRTDLPGGNYETLIRSIKERFWLLPLETVVYPGHGPSTTIGYEKMHNPFLN